MSEHKPLLCQSLYFPINALLSAFSTALVDASVSPLLSFFSCVIDDNTIPKSLGTVLASDCHTMLLTLGSIKFFFQNMYNAIEGVIACLGPQSPETHTFNTYLTELTAANVPFETALENVCVSAVITDVKGNRANQSTISGLKVD
jgi:hypothetical protein